jgi:hypothetical protein
MNDDELEAYVMTYVAHLENCSPIAEQVADLLDAKDIDALTALGSLIVAMFAICDAENIPHPVVVRMIELNWKLLTIIKQYAEEKRRAAKSNQPKP